MLQFYHMFAYCAGTTNCDLSVVMKKISLLGLMSLWLSVSGLAFAAPLEATTTTVKEREHRADNCCRAGHNKSPHRPEQVSPSSTVETCSVCEHHHHRKDPVAPARKRCYVSSGARMSHSSSRVCQQVRCAPRTSTCENQDLAVGCQWYPNQAKTYFVGVCARSTPSSVQAVSPSAFSFRGESSRIEDSGIQLGVKAGVGF